MKKQKKIEDGEEAKILEERAGQASRRQESAREKAKREEEEPCGRLFGGGRGATVL